MRIAIVTNILTPYRTFFYKELDSQLRVDGGELKVLVLTDYLPLRPWNYEGLKQSFTELVPGKKIFIGENDYLINLGINKRLRKFSPNIIIVAGSWTYPTMWVVAKHKIEKVKYFFWTESHNNRAIKIGTNNPIILKLKCIFYELFDGFCIPGKYANEAIDRLIGKRGWRIFLPNLVDDRYYSKAIELRHNKNELREKYSLPKDKLIFICPARIIEIKGIRIFLQNVADCPNINKTTFVLAGDGPDKSKVAEVSDKMNIDVRMLGYCDQDKIRDLYALADAFLLPSLLDANPLTSIEAAFAGLPLLVSRYTGNSPELVKNKINGVIFDTVFKESVTDAMKFILGAERSWFDRAGEYSHKIAMENFQCKRETNKLIRQLRDHIGISD